MDRKTKVLFLAANPSDSTKLRLDEEARAVNLVLQQAELRDEFEIITQWAVRVSDLQIYLLRHKPDIVHFSGHGSFLGEICLEDDCGTIKIISVSALSKLFALFKDNIKCVILNACFSELQAESIAGEVDFVIGMSVQISDKAAIRFSSAFYQALGFGKDFQTAFQAGCLEIDLHGLGEENTPKLLTQKSAKQKSIVDANSDNVSLSSSSGDNDCSSFLLKLDFDVDGKVVCDDSELMALAGDTIYAVENGDNILYDINYKGLTLYQEAISKPFDQLNPSQRAFRPDILKQIKHFKKRLHKFTEVMNIVLMNPIYQHVMAPYCLAHIFRGLGKRFFGKSGFTSKDSFVVLDLYFGENPEIYTVIDFRRMNDDDTNYHQFIGGGWDLYDLPTYVRFEYAIPAIILEYLQLLEKGNQTELSDILNLYGWKMGLR